MLTFVVHILMVRAGVHVGRGHGTALRRLAQRD